MKDDSHLYLDVEALRNRGWTDNLIKRFLGQPDRWDPVDHWANFTGKRTFFLERVQFAENFDIFKEAFMKSIQRRRLDKDSIEAFFLVRTATSQNLERWRESLTGDDIKKMRTVEKAAEIFEEMRSRGYRTPHKS